MADLVNPGQIEKIVGARRHSTKHLGRYVTMPDGYTIYILHSAECKATGRDLRECPFSLALDEGTFVPFDGHENRPIVLAIDSHGCLGPADVIALAEGSPSWPDRSEPVEYLEESDRQ